MKRTLSFVIPGRPVGKGRPRFFRRGAGVGTYTPKETVTYENWVRSCAIEAMPAGWVPLDAPLEVRLVFLFVRPKSVKGRLYPHGRPDIDQLIKSVLDGMQLAGVYKDDARICRVEASKQYTVDVEGYGERATVQVFEL